MRLILILLFATTFLLVSGCGGGGGDVDGDSGLISEGESDNSESGSSSSNETVAISTDVLTQHKQGDEWSYELTYESAYYDGSSPQSVNGRLDVVILNSSYLSPLLLNEFAMSRVVTEGQSVVSSVIDHYGYDLSGGLRHFLLGDLYYVNQSDPEAGVLDMPGVLGVGLSWASKELREHPDGDAFYEITINYAITAKEVVETGYGKVEAYRVVYGGGGESEEDILGFRSRQSFSGIIWVNPSIGIVAQSESGEFSQFNISQFYELSISLLGSSVLQ